MSFRNRPYRRGALLLAVSMCGLLVGTVPSWAEPPDRPGMEIPADTSPVDSPRSNMTPANITPAENTPVETMPGDTPPAAQTAAVPNHVDIDNFDFAPMSLTVAVGTTVVWANHDDVPHTVLSSDEPPAFKSPPLDTDDSYSFTFTKPGTYKYFCSVHPKMVGLIIVK